MVIKPKKYILLGKKFVLFNQAFYEVLLVLSLGIIVCLIYSNTLSSTFHFDDSHNILENAHIRLQNISWQGLMDAGFQSPCMNRPIANISFALNYYWGRYNVEGYHVVNILIHILTGILLYLFIKTTMEVYLEQAPGETWEPSIVAYLASLLWIVHPVQTQAVTYIVQRMASMAAMFYILSFLLYVRARLAKGSRGRWFLYAGSIAAFVMALGSKEIAATLPIMILIYEWFFFQDMNWRWMRRYLSVFLVIAVMFILAVFLYTGAHPLSMIASTYDNREFTLIERVLTEFRVVMLYASLLVFPSPSRLNLDYGFPISHSLVDPVTTLLSIIAITGIVGLACYLAKRERLISFCILWFFINLAIESSVIGLELVFEHRLYLPSMLIVLLPVMVGYRYAKTRWVAIGFICLVVSVFSVWTYQRNAVWADDLTLWSDCVAKSPQKARSYNDLALALAEKKRYDDAVKHLLKALELEPNRKDAMNNLGLVLLEQGKIDDAINQFKKVIKIYPYNIEAQSNLANAFSKKNNVDDVIKTYAGILEKNPGSAEAHSNLGIFLVRRGDLEKGISHFRAAIKLNPTYADAYYNLGIALLAQGKADEAIENFREALRIEPKNGQVHYNMGIALANKGDMDGAVEHFSRAVTLDPGNALAQNNLGNAFLGKGEIEKAINHFQEALRLKADLVPARENLKKAIERKEKIDGAIVEAEGKLGKDPNDVGMLNRLAVLYASKGENARALSYLERVVEITPGSGDAYYNIACIYAREGKSGESIQWLKKAKEKGFNRWDLMRTDRDLQNIRNTTYYRELMKTFPKG